MRTASPRHRVHRSRHISPYPPAPPPPVEIRQFYSPGPAGLPCLFNVNIDNGTFARIIYNEIYEQGQYDIPQCTPAPGKVVLDIGANIGMYSRWALEKGADLVYAIEPELCNYNCLLRNAPAAISYHAAMTDHMGVSDLWHTTAEGGHTVFDLKRGDTLEHVPAFTLGWFLDNVSGPVDVLKCDTEGSEHPIFSTLLEQYYDQIGSIIMEYHHAVLHRYQPLYYEQLMKTLARHYQMVESRPLCPELSIVTAWR